MKMNDRNTIKEQKYCKCVKEKNVFKRKSKKIYVGNSNN